MQTSVKANQPTVLPTVLRNAKASQFLIFSAHSSRGTARENGPAASSKCGRRLSKTRHCPARGEGAA